MDLSSIIGNVGFTTDQKIKMIESLGIPVPPELVSQYQAEQRQAAQASQPTTTDMIPQLEGAEMTIALKRGPTGQPEAYFYQNGSYQKIASQAEFLRIAGQYFT